jgi:glucose-1-phosphate cytidylyltransferase
MSAVAVILAGGFGTRLAEFTELIPKPMVPVGDHPMLWHIMNCYARCGVEDFIIALGYKGEVIKEYFHNFSLRNSDFAVDLGTGQITTISQAKVNWRVRLIDTGLNTMTGGRLKRLEPILKSYEYFFVTYGDGVSDVDVNAPAEQHRRTGATVTMTVVRPPGRYGQVTLDGERALAFAEKPMGDGGWINGGFFVMSPSVFDYIRNGDATALENEPLETLAHEGRLSAYRHNGFWQAMDTLRDKKMLDAMCERGDTPWLARP